MPYVFIIEDEPDHLALLVHHMTKEGFVVDMATDGRTGLGSVHREEQVSWANSATGGSSQREPLLAPEFARNSRPCHRIVTSGGDTPSNHAGSIHWKHADADEATARRCPVPWLDECLSHFGRIRRLISEGESPPPK